MCCAATVRPLPGDQETCHRGVSALPVLPGRPGDFHPERLTEPYVNLSIYAARATARRLRLPWNEGLILAYRLVHPTGIDIGRATPVGEGITASALMIAGRVPATQSNACSMASNASGHTRPSMATKFCAGSPLVGKSTLGLPQLPGSSLFGRRRGFREVGRRLQTPTHQLYVRAQIVVLVRIAQWHANAADRSAYVVNLQ